MERLTVPYISKYGYAEINPVDIYDNSYSVKNYQEILNKLGEYEDLDEQELLLKLPCRVGTTVYHIDYSKGIIKEDTVLEFSLDEDDLYINLKSCKWVVLDTFKNHFFFTKEEAELFYQRRSRK